MEVWEPNNYEEINILIDNIDLNKNSNIPLIQVKFLKDCLSCQATFVMNLVNLALHTGKFPYLWKIACIIPLHKGGVKTAVNNYRPISLLPLMGKLLEKALHRRLYCYLDIVQFFNEEQCGFRPKRGTDDAISNLLEDTYNNINQKIQFFQYTSTCRRHSTQ